MTSPRDYLLAPGTIGLPRARFVTVLALLLGFIVLEVSLEFRGTSPVLMGLSSAAILLIAIVAATDDKRHHRSAFVLATLALVVDGVSLAGFHPWNLPPGPSTSAVFAGYATWRLFRAVVGSRRVTGDVLAGALAAYVLAGLSFALVYGVIEARWRGSFIVDGGQADSFADMIYFSFVTLLTIGFGDVLPVTGPARAVTILEGLFGVVYTTVVLAALVAAYLGQNVGRPSHGHDETGFSQARAGHDDDGAPVGGGRLGE